MPQITHHSCVRVLLLKSFTGEHGCAGFFSPVEEWERVWVSTSTEVMILELGFPLLPPLCKKGAGEMSCACVGFRTSSPGARSEGWPPHVKWDSTCTVVRIWVNWSDSLQYHIDSFVPRKLCFISTGKTTCDSDFVFYQS